MTIMQVRILFASNKTTQYVQITMLFHRCIAVFQDVHVMMYIGFGFLMVFLKRYGYGAVSFTFMIAAIAVQWGIIVEGFFHMKNGKFYVSILRL